MKFASFITLCLLTLFMGNAYAGIPVAQGELSGNLSVLSSYNLRGMTNDPENSNVAVQGGLEYGHSSGFYMGYWGSTLDYNAENTASTADNSFESNIYGGYNFKLNDDVSFTLGGTYYLYYPSDNSNVFETYVGFNYKDFALTAQTLTDDVTWGNKGDTYFLASYSYPLKYDFNLNTAVGAYYYQDKGEFIDSSQETFAFRHATVGLSRDIAQTGLTWNVDYILGGNDRDGNKQKNKVVLGLSYQF